MSDRKYDESVNISWAEFKVLSPRLHALFRRVRYRESYYELRLKPEVMRVVANHNKSVARGTHAGVSPPPSLSDIRLAAMSSYSYEKPIVGFNAQGQQVTVSIGDGGVLGSPVVSGSPIGETSVALNGPVVTPSLVKGMSWAPFPRIPNVRTFRVITGEMDEMFASFGIRKRTSSRFEFTYYQNQAALRYAAFTITRLRGTQSSALYWHRVHVLMSRSRVFTMMAISKVFDRWHRDLPLHLVMSLVYGSWKIASRWDAGLEMVKKYIPKSNGKLRPLGVPSPVWRVYLTQLNWWLVTRYDGLLGEWQHGFRPGRGTGTAWSEVLSKVIKGRYIYEFDLKGFFNAVNVAGVLRFLESKGLSEGFSRQIKLMSMVPNLRFADFEPGSDHPQPESDKTTFEFIDDPLDSSGNMKVGSSSDVAEDYIRSTVSDPRDIYGDYVPWSQRDPARNPDVSVIGARRVVLPSLSLGGPLKAKAIQELARSRRRVAKPAKPEYVSLGFPQGANISPFLSAIALAVKGDPPFAKLLMYADDGLFYSDKKFTSADVLSWFESLEIPVSEEKSGWVKDNYKWIKPLKFLGMEFDGESFRASTRKGASLVYDKAGLVRCVSGELEKLEPVHQVVGYVVYGTLPSGHYESVVFRTLREARQHRLALASAAGYLRIRMLDPSGCTLTSVLPESEESPGDFDTWEALAKSKIFGLIQSRMYSDSWNIDMDQDFRLKFVSRSWVGRYYQRSDAAKLTFANSTSYAFHDVCNLLRFSRSNARWKEQYKKGLIDLAEFNRRRISIGFDPWLGGGFRRLKRITRADGG